MSSWIFYLFLAPLLHLPVWFGAPRQKNLLHILPGFLLFGSLLTYLIMGEIPVKVHVPFWLGTLLAPVSVSFLLDEHHLSMACLSAGMAWLIQWYSFGYLAEKQRFGLYQFLLSAFSAAMAWLFLAGNLFTLLLGWEWVGLVSYLLVQFWLEKKRPLQAGLRVLLINKIGDVFLLTATGLLVAYGFQSTVFDRWVFPAGAEVFFQSRTGIVLGLYLAFSAFIKSAQFPFNIWLNEAMEGPTAVSALLHSATMVTAGVWLLISCFPMLAPEVKLVLLVFGAITLIVSNLGAIFSLQLKSVLAFSTMAQLGLMIMAISLGNLDGVKLHLFSHAFFKSALFLMAGIIMHHLEEKGLHGEAAQHLQQARGLFATTPKLRLAWIFCLLGLMGFPLTAGFISKESMLPHVFHGESLPLVWMAYFIMQLGILLTATYATRLLFWVGFGNGPCEPLQAPSPTMGIPVYILSLLVGFWIFGPHPFAANGWLSDFWQLKNVGTVFPDVLMSGLGMMAGYLTLRGKNAYIKNEQSVWVRWFSRLPLQYQLVSLSGQGLLRFSQLTVKAEEKLLERPIIFFSKAGVVFGHLVAFFDRRVVDGVVMLLAGIARGFGAYFWRQAEGRPQQTVFLVFIFLIFILFWLIY